MSTGNDIIVKLTALGDDFERGMADASSAFAGLLKNLSGGSAGFAAAATASIAAGGALFSLAKMTADYGEQLKKMSTQTGIGVEDLSLLKYAAEQSETSLESLGAGIKFMNKNLIEAGSGNAQAERSFRALGISIKQMEVLGTKDRLLLLADALKDVEDPALRSKLAMDILGRGAVDMLPFLTQGREGIEALTGRARDMGLTMSEETAAQSDEFNDSLSALWEVTKQLSYDIGALLLPPLTWLFNILQKLVEFIKNYVLAAFDFMRLEFDLLVKALLTVVQGWAKLSDALGITSGKSEEVGKWIAAVSATAEESAKKVGVSFGKLTDAFIGTAHAQEGVNKTTKEHTDLTDAQRKAILDEEAAQKAATKSAKEAADAQKQWMTEVNASINDYLAELGRTLDYKKTIKQFDDEYFEAYKNQLLVKGYTEVQAQEMVNAEKERLRQEDKTQTVYVNELIKTAVKGVAESVKMLWSDTTVTFRDVWTGAANAFVDVMAEMVVQSITTGQAIQLNMAAATAGVSLLVGLIAMTFTRGKGGGQSAIESATSAFLRAIRQTLTKYQDEILSVLEKITAATTAGQSGFDVLKDLVDKVIATLGTGLSGVLQRMRLRETIAGSMGALQKAITDRYDLEKKLINDVFSLLKNKASFVSDIQSAITGVSRAGFSAPQMFAALQQDLAGLWQGASGTTGQDRVERAGLLKDTLMALWQSGQSFLTGDALTALQDSVIAGLQDVQALGVSGYDQLIDINLDMLGVQREGTDLQAQMVQLLSDVNAALLDSLATMQAIAVAPFDANLEALVAKLGAALSILGFDIPQMAAGGVVTKPTLAMIGERGPEAVMPLSQMGLTGGNTFHLALSLPGVTNLNGLTVAQAEQLLNGVFYQAAERLGRTGRYWPMPSR